MRVLAAFTLLWVSTALGLATTYATWKTQVFSQSQQADPSKSGKNASPSGDGITNLQKYAMGMNPMQHVTTGMPTFSQVTQSSQNFMALTYQSPAIDPPTDLLYTVQASSDLQTWQQGTGMTSLYATQGPINGLMFTTWMANGLPITVPTGTPACLFVRLRLCETAIISLASGIYTSAQPLTITGAPGVSFYYTLDGSTPISTSGTLYTTPLTVSQTETLKVQAYLGGSPYGGVAVAYYAFSGSFTWSGAINSSWDNATANWLVGAVASPYLNNAALVFNDSAAGGTISLNGTFSPASLSATNSAKNYTLTSGGLTGTMTLTKSGMGTLTLAEANAYTGLTTITAGTLQFQGAGTLPSTSGIQLGAATLKVAQDGAGSNGTVTLGNNIVISSATTAATLFAGNNGSSNSGNVMAFGSLANGTASSAQNSTINFTGANGYGLSFTSLSLSGSTGYGTTLNPTSCWVSVSNVTNPMTSSAGHHDTLILGGTSTGNTISGVIGDSSGYSSVGNGDTRVTASGTGAWTLTGTSTYHGPTAVSSGTLTLSGALPNTQSLTTSGSGILNETSGTIGGAATFTQGSTGRTTLGGANTYSGATTVSAGTLLVNGSITSPASVSSGAILGGSGIVTGNVSVASGGALSFNVSSLGVAPLTIHGNLALSGTIKIMPNFLPGGTLFPGTYNIATWSGTLSGTPSFVWTPPAGGPVAVASVSMVVGNEIVLTVPTPPAAVANLSQSTPSTSEIDLSWTLPTSNAPTGLTVQQSVNGGAWTNVATLGATATSYAATGLSSGNSYSYQVVSTGSTGSSDSATSAALAPGTPIPSGVTALTGSYDYKTTTMNLSWTAASGATSYSIDRENLTTGVWATGFGATSNTTFSDPANAAGPYHYRVSAINAAGTSGPSGEYPTIRYALIDLGANYYPAQLANNGMILGGPITQPSYGWYNLPPLNACPFLGNYQFSGYYQLNARWVQGTWQPLAVPGAQQFNASQINDNGAVVGYASFAVADTNFNSDVRGVIWTQNPASPEIDPSDNIITFSDGTDPYGLRAYNLCTDSTAATDYSVGRIYGFQDSQGIEVINNAGQGGNIHSQPNPHSQFPDHLFYQGDGAYFAGSAAPSYLGTANFYGNLGYDPYIEPTNGPPFTGSREVPTLANNNWIVSTQSVWPTGLAQSSDDTDPTIRTTTFSSSTTTPGTFSTTQLPATLQQSGVYLHDMTHAQTASDDIVVGGGLTNGSGFLWNIGSTAAPLPIDDISPGAINSRYFTPATSQTNPTPAPVPDFQITGSSALWERTADATGLPLTPIAYTGTPYAAMIAPNPAYGAFGVSSINDSGALIGCASKLLNSDGTPTPVDQNGNHPTDGVLLLPAELAVDCNNDGHIVLANDPNNPANVDTSGNPLPVDSTSAAKPYRFWVNNDCDSLGAYPQYPAVQSDGDPSAHPADYADGIITCTRDLEDFTLLCIYVKQFSAAIQSGNIQIGLRMVATSGSPSINLYQSWEEDGLNTYLTDANEALFEQTADNGTPLTKIGNTIDSTHPLIIPKQYFNSSVNYPGLSDANPKRYFIFEASGRGQGQLVLTFNDKNGKEIGSGSPVYLDLRDIKEMYERWTVDPSTTEDSSGGTPSASARLSTRALPVGLSTPFQYSSTGPEAKKYIVFVHGWNMIPWEKDSFAETAFKRLHWEGYNGRFAAFQWPTTYGFPNYGGVPNASLLLDRENYDNGEFSAWRSGTPLANLLASFNSQCPGAVNIFGHSMGNVVTGEALRVLGRSGQHIHSYVACQAALEAETYDASTAAKYPLNFSYQQPALGGADILGYGPTTPDIYPTWLSPVSSGVSQKARFYNENDFALSPPVWEWDQISKPDNTGFTTGWGWAGHNIVTDNPDQFYRDGSSSNLHLGTQAAPQDRFEIMSYAAEPRSRALGRFPGIDSTRTLPPPTSEVVGFSGSVNLETIWYPDTAGSGDHKDRQWHSGEFHFTLDQQKVFWNRLMTAFNIPPHEIQNP